MTGKVALAGALGASLFGLPLHSPPVVAAPPSAAGADGGPFATPGAEGSFKAAICVLHRYKGEPSSAWTRETSTACGLDTTQVLALVSEHVLAEIREPGCQAERAANRTMMDCAAMVGSCMQKLNVCESLTLKDDGF